MAAPLLLLALLPSNRLAAVFPRRCDGGAAHGSALAGDNLEHFSIADGGGLADCAARCCDDAACTAWTFVSWDPYNLLAGDNCTHAKPCCYLKSAASAPYRCPNCTSWSERGPLPPPRPAPPPPAPAPPHARPLPHPLPNGGGACASIEDCTLGGVCHGGKCLCDPQWTGSQCAQLHLLPARVGSGYPSDPVPGSVTLPTNSSFTWGGAVVEENGTYHGFFVEWLDHCPMTYGTWSTQTHIRHAVSTLQDGPWRPLDVAVPNAAGNPVLSRAPDGTWLLYFTNHRWTGAVRNCTGPVGQWGPPVYCTATGKQCATGVSLAYSRYLTGPWTIKYDVVSVSATNPGAPIFHSDGSLLMAYKTWAKGGKCIGILVASSWKAWPYQRAPGTAQCIGVGRNLEDPSNLWRDARGAIHVLFHQGCGSSTSGGCNTNGSLAAYGGGAGSADGKSWDYNLTRVAYEYDVDMDDGSVLHCSHREEPKVLLGADGQPTMLITQCTLPQALPNTVPTPAFPRGEGQHITRVVMQPINTERKPMHVTMNSL
eukprot:COSAG01_NODE_155_length_23814_cov_12.061343_3_plen_539_part_00